MKPGPKIGFRGTEEIRFWSKVIVQPNGCWLWMASKVSGYGSFRLSNPRGKIPAHRWAYNYCIGPIPKGLEPDHLCRNRACVNPAHLEPVTRRTNLLRGKTIVAAMMAKVNCINGHPLSGSNLKPNKKGHRICRICNKASRARSIAKGKKP